MRILGVSAFYHDSAAALVDGGRVVAAAQEERFSRVKGDPGYPHRAVEYCVRQSGGTTADIDRVVFYDKPFLKFERLLETYIAFAPRGFRSFAMALPLWVKEKLFQKDLLRRRLKAAAPNADWNERLLFAEHHQSHAASAFYPSPFRDAAVLTLDGVGEWATASASIGSGNSLQIISEMHFPHSLGLLYAAFTYHAGFKVNSGEYKLMGLAPYGEPKYAAAIMDNLIDVKSDGSFRLNLDYFDYCVGLKMTNDRFDGIFGCPPRADGEPISQRHMDIAASAQAVLEEVVVRLARALRAETGMRSLCMAGGVALNCVANAAILRRGGFDDIWIQPAAGDAGGALGAALAASHGLFGEPRQSLAAAPAAAVHPALPAAAGRAVIAAPPVAPDAPDAPNDHIPDAMNGAQLGPEYADAEIRRRLDAAGARYEAMGGEALVGAAAAAIAQGKAVGWFQGRMEFGPRALGNRSILADARRPDMQRVLNLKVKSRESFRPFAPSVMLEDAPGWFALDRESPYMLLTADAKPQRPGRADLPAATHVDGSARVQTVRRETNPRYHALLAAFKALTGCSAIVNTSFNVRGEPIVCEPEDAFRCFMGTEIDCLAIGNFFLRKEDQNPALLIKGYENAFEPD